MDHLNMQHLTKLSLIILSVLCFSLLSTNMSSYVVAYEKQFEENFHIDETNPILKYPLFHIQVFNEIFFHCSLSTDSTNNITLLVEPKAEWNISQLLIRIGESVNVTVTNGNLNLAPDVSALFKLVIERVNNTDVISGHLFVGVLTFGWQQNVPWPVVPGLLALTVLSFINIKRIR